VTDLEIFQIVPFGAADDDGVGVIGVIVIVIG
jgi:hypothetical protein